MSESEDVEAELMQRFEERFAARNNIPPLCPRCKKRHAIWCPEAEEP